MLRERPLRGRQGVNHVVDAAADAGLVALCALHLLLQPCSESLHARREVLPHTGDRVAEVLLGGLQLADGVSKGPEGGVQWDQLSPDVDQPFVDVILLLCDLQPERAHGLLPRGGHLLQARAQGHEQAVEAAGHGSELRLHVLGGAAEGGLLSTLAGLFDLLLSPCLVLHQLSPYAVFHLVPQSCELLGQRVHRGRAPPPSAPPDREA
mmetsp:Transcript_76857/g.225585  ORF Transcript_76857/g.225585 Transcript_76857/m.225585 type:complete len:208 (-) Transcript_76857:7-630(-)